jgi:hypothetical protein
MHFVSDAQDKVISAEQALAKARKLEARRAVAELTGADSSDFGPTVQGAESLLRDAVRTVIQSEG